MSASIAESALACRCREPTPPQAYRAADSVAYGKVVSVKRENQGADVVYVFDVAEAWKRPLGPAITIHSGTTCSFEAELGEEYVVFLKLNKPDVFETAKCMGNRSAADARATLDYLRATKPAK